MKNKMVNLSDMFDIVNDLNRVAFKNIGSVDVGLWDDDGTVTIEVSDPVGNILYREDRMTATQVYNMLRGMLYGTMILKGEDI